MIEKALADAPAPAAGGIELPRTGSLLAKTRPDTPLHELKPCPLAHTDVKAAVAGYVAATDVTQTFQNPFAVKIEAVYVFPLPANAAVNEFLMTVGDRRIRGVVRERQQAEQIYREARSQGYVASLLTQDRPNLFTQSVANIEPGKRIDITIRYFNTLTYSDGWYELAFPMVVGPRFNPPGSTNGVGAVGQGARGATGQKTEVSYLAPGTRSGHDISLAVDLDAGVPFEELKSVNHSVAVKKVDERRSTVTLDPADSIPNKDFVLRWKVAGDKVKSGFVYLPGERDGHFAMMVVPPADLKHLPQQPLEFVFTLDVSGSMSGRPLEQAKRAMVHALRRLGPQDRFQVVTFASNAEQWASEPQPATPENVDRAMGWVSRSQAGGGTMMLEGMRKSLDFPRDPGRLRVVAFLTDGYIGNEAEILTAMHGWLGNTRVFSFGVGSSVNRYLLDHMAKEGRGAAAYVSLNETGDEAMGAFFDRVRHPAMTDLAIDFGSFKARDVYPRKLPDLLVGRPVIVTGKFEPAAPGTPVDAQVRPVRVTGRAGGETLSIDVTERRADPVMAKALPALWARSKIADVADEAARATNVDVVGTVKQVALEYGLMSSFTAFVAVDGSTKTAGDHGVSTPVAVPVPDGVRYDTTVTGKPTAIAQPASERVRE
ncbi:MAG TPA: VIT domain-containing protein [Humisphaera sp.]